MQPRGQFDTGVDAGRNETARQRAEPGRPGRVRVRSRAARRLAAVPLAAFAVLLALPLQAQAPNSAPVFSDPAPTLILDETLGAAPVSAAADIGAAVAATDADNDTLSYTLDGTDKDRFTFVSTSGQIRTKVGERYDTEANPSLSVTVTADDGNGGTATADVTIFILDMPEPPLTPTGLTLVQADPSSLALSWTAPDNTGRPAITRYGLRYGTDGMNWTTRGFSGTAVSATLTGLAAGTEYEVQVQAENNEGFGDWSESLTASTTTAPVAPPGVTVSATTLTVPEGDTTGNIYTVVLDSQPTADVTVTVAGHTGTDVTLTPDPATLTFTSLNWDTAQTVTVKAGNDANTTDETVTLTHSATSTDSRYAGITIADVTVTVEDTTLQVMGVTVAPGHAQLVVSWTAVDGATGYKVEWKAGFEGYNDTDRQTTVTPGSTTSYTISNLTNGITYTVRVIATRTGASDGPPSAEVMETPTLTPPRSLTDREALEALYDATGGGDTWTTETNWMDDNQPLNAWHGVTTDSDDNVTRLDLPSNNLSGSLPAALGNLRELTTVNLGYNTLSGPIPPELVYLRALRALYLNNNALNGSIPAALGQLTALQYLRLDTNALGGEIPAELGQLTALTDLRLHTNALSGSIPAELGDLPVLALLHLHTNALSGSIPAALGDLAALQELVLNDNNLSGPIPPELGQLSDPNDSASPAKLAKLRVLWLHNNALDGAIPSELGSLLKLQYLYLHTNALSGSIPAALGDLAALLHLHLHTNALDGTIPSELGDLAALTVLYLYNNNLSGSLPAELGQLRALQYLRLDNNNLSGPLPAALGDLAAIKTLYLHNNADLSGDLPTTLTTLTTLQELAVQNTQVTVPDDMAVQTWLASITFTTGIQRSTGTITLDAANTTPGELWSDGTTLWVADWGAAKVFAYSMLTGSRNTARDIPLDTANTVPMGLWSDGTTLWVADYLSRTLYAYTLADRSRDPDKDIALANAYSCGLWSDGTTLWVARCWGPVYAYTLADGSRDTDKDITLHAGNGSPRGLWSDGTTLWVANDTGARLYAYTLADGSHAPDAYRILDPANTTPFGIWSNGVTWWVADFPERTVYLYRPNQEFGAVGTLPAQALGVGGNAQTIPVENAFRSPAATPLKYTATSSDEMVATVAVSGTEVTVQPVGVGTTTITVTATEADAANRGATQSAGVTKNTPRAEEVVATQRFEVTVESGPPPNQGPQAVGMLPDLTLAAGASAQAVAVGDAFRDPDGDVLTYTAVSSHPRIATVTVSGAEVRVHPQAEGITGITVTATDTSGANQTATQRFEVRVTPPPPPPPPPVTGGGGGGGGGSTQDQHGNTPAQATAVQVGSTAPWMSSTAGQISPANDVDYFTLIVPQAGVLVVETSGFTDTVGTVWQAGEELGMADSGGERRNFRLAVPVAAGPVVIAVAGTGRRTGAYTLRTQLVVGYLENPGADSFQSGIGVLSGWVCEAETVTLELDGVAHVAAYGTERGDTQGECGDTDNGFGLLFNWNLLDDGEHEVVAFVDGIELDRATVTVTTLGSEFLRDVAGTCTVPDFPMPGETVRVAWQQSQQNFVLAEGAAPSGETRAGIAGVGVLENPGPNSFQSGVGVLSGWVCEADTVTLELNGVAHVAAYGTERGDTEDTCGDTNNGFGLLFNWNLLGDGEHAVVAYVDDEELGRATVRVTTLGAEFLRRAAGACVAEDFPTVGETVTLRWQQSQQNFVVTDIE